MFTGIVERTVRVAAVADGPKFRRLTLAAHWADAVRLGESIAVNGCCLTVAEISDESVAFDVVQESLDKTNLGSLTAGDEVHVERSLRVGDRIDGHFVQGHVDGTGECVAQRSHGADWRLAVRPPENLRKYIVPKGSIAIDGVSLTIASVEEDSFEVALIPTTLAVTALGRRPIGWRFNLEADVVTKTVVTYLERQRDAMG
jgi:riboflavin synthase